MLQIVPPEKAEAMKKAAWNKIAPGTLFRTQTTVAGSYGLPHISYIAMGAPTGNLLKVISLNPSNRSRLIMGQQPEVTVVSYEKLKGVDIQDDVKNV